MTLARLSEGWSLADLLALSVAELEAWLAAAGRVQSRVDRAVRERIARR